MPVLHLFLWQILPQHEGSQLNQTTKLFETMTYRRSEVMSKLQESKFLTSLSEEQRGHSSAEPAAS